MNSRRCISSPQDFIAHVLQNVDGALDANLPGEDGVFVLDAQDAVVADVHVSLNNGFPKTGAVAIAHGTESFRCQIKLVGFKSEIEDAVFVAILRKENR